MIRKSPFLALPVVALLAGSVAQAAAPDLPLSQIVERNIAARGGASAWHGIKALQFTGTMDIGTTLPNPAKMAEDAHHPAAPRKRIRPEVKQAAEDIRPITAPFVMDLKRPRMSRVELKVKDQTAIQVFDGKQGWKVRPYIGRHVVEAFTPQELKIAQGEQELDGPLLDYAAKGTKVEKAGIEQVDGRDAYKLRLTLKDGQQRELWIDAQTFLDLQIASVNPKGRKTQRITTRMDDYRAVQGVQVPFKLVNHVEGVAIPQRILIEQVAVNPALADNLFHKPE